MRSSVELFCMGMPALGLLGILVYSFSVGLRAYRTSRNTTDEYDRTLRYLALNLCEPLINTALICGLLWLRSRVVGSSPSWIEPVFWTSPMAVLLLPLRGQSFSDPLYRRLSLRIFKLGMVRWIVNTVSLGLLPFISGSGALFTILGLVCVIVLPIFSIGFLIYCINWGERQLNGILLPPLATVFPPAANPGPVYSMARPAAAPAVVAPVVPLTYSNAAACPHCQELVALDGDACHSCGLVLLSRIPEALSEIPRYTVLRPLGGGGMSSVYLARDRSNEKYCVLKTLATIDTHHPPAWHAEALRCLEQEAELLTNIQHPGIVPLVGWYRELNADFLVMEYIAGPSLERELTRIDSYGAIIPGAALKPGLALAHAASVANVLCFLSTLPEPVVHCDIKPANIILPNRTDPVLIDFGSATVQRAGSNQTMRLEKYGTPGYAAPEQYQGACAPTSDVYGLAATLYHLLTDDDPSAHPLTFPALNRLPNEIVQPLSLALSHDPADRPSPQEWAAMLQRLAQQYT